MQTINNYNIDNSYTDNSTTVNYFIGSLADDGSVTDVYSPALYDEETLIFTEPVTGAQYQTTGWIYDYTTRTYDITLDTGTYLIDGTDVTRIVCTYGDDLVTITYYDSNGTALATDEYSYVMISGSGCVFEEHSYTAETTKEPTCTTPGERKYTCSVCGDEYAEDIPATGSHAYQYSVDQAPTCTASGTALYTCSVCGNQYTEPISATGHIDQILEIVPTVYDADGIVVSVGYTVYECTVCGYQHRVNDEIEADSEGLLSGFTSALKSAASKLWSAISSGIGKLFSGFADLLGGFFSFLSDTLLGGVKDFFASFSDGTLFDFWTQENEDGTTTTALPSGIAAAFAFISGVFMLFPVEIRSLFVFLIAVLIFLGVLKLVRS